MKHDGPDLERLTRRLADTPVDFLAEPAIGTRGGVAVAALVNDLLALYGARACAGTLARFEGWDAHADRNRLALAMIVVWLLADEWFRDARLEQPALVAVLDETVAELAGAAPAHRFVNDPERREELARSVLAAIDYRPRGETPEQAGDRLAAMSGTARRKLIEASRGSEKRARAIREALFRKAAEESADKWTRE
ncbi:hypothetical protein ACSUZJ_12020 [Telluria sp. B2]